MASKLFIWVLLAVVATALAVNDDEEKRSGLLDRLGGRYPQRFPPARPDFPYGRPGYPTSFPDLPGSGPEYPFGGPGRYPTYRPTLPPGVTVPPGFPTYRPGPGFPTYRPYPGRPTYRPHPDLPGGIPEGRLY